MDLEHLNACHEASVKRLKLVDKCKIKSSVVGTFDVEEVVRLLQAEDKDDRTYNECLFEAILYNSVPLVKAIVTMPVSTTSPAVIPWSFFAHAKSREVAALLVEHKGCHHSTIVAFVTAVHCGRVKLDRDLLIDLVVKCCRSPTTINHADVKKLFGWMVKLKSIDGVTRMLDTWPPTSGWRTLAAANDPAAVVVRRYPMKIFKQLLILASALTDRSMFESIHSMILPYPDFYRGVISDFAPAIYLLNPWVFVTHARAEWYSAERLLSQSEKLVDPHLRKVSEQFLFRLAAVLHLQSLNSGRADPSSRDGAPTYGTSIATQLLTEASPDWMRSIKSRHDEIIEALLTLLPQDLVILSLTYFVGQ